MSSESPEVLLRLSEVCRRTGLPRQRPSRGERRPRTPGRPVRAAPRLPVGPVPLGVLDDVTVGQSSPVLALRSANPGLGFGQLFGTALRVGRDHVSATVNTLVLAYVGASLPLLLHELHSARSLMAADDLGPALSDKLMGLLGPGEQADAGRRK